MELNCERESIVNKFKLSTDYGTRTSYSSRSSFTDPLTPPPTIRKSWFETLQTRLALFAVFIFVLCIVISLILVIANMHNIK